MDSDAEQRVARLHELSLEQLREELECRGLKTEGILPVLRARLTKAVRCEQLGWRPPPTPETEGEDSGDDRASGESSTGTIIKDDRVRTPGMDFAEHLLQPPLLQLPRREPEIRAPARRTDSATDVYQMMRRWNLKFSGARGCDAEAFLLRIEEGRALFTATDADVFKCIPFFLNGTALYWYRNERGRWRTWKEFETSWRARFGSPDFQFALREDIQRRTQGEYESIADFLTCIRAMFERLSPPWSLEEQLNQAHRNMLPRLQIVVQRRDFYDFASLESQATRVEQGYEAASRYRAPPPPEQMIFPDLAYRAPPKSSKKTPAVAAIGLTDNLPGKKRAERRARKEAARATKAQSNSARQNSEAAASTSNVASSSHANSAKSSGKCWNCDKAGHIARECAEPRRRESLGRAPVIPEYLEKARAEATSEASSLSSSSLGDDARTLSQLPYCEISLGGETLRALIDSGSNRTILGAAGIKIIRRLRSPINRDHRTQIRTANGQLAEVREEAEITLQVAGRSRDVSTCLLPSLAVPCILGVDFLRAFKVIVDFAAAEWYFADESTCRYPFLNNKGSAQTCCGLSELTPSETERLGRFLKERLPDPVENPGVTSLTEHTIDVGQNKPIRQRCYLVSPKVQEAIHAEVDKMLRAGIIEPSHSEWSNPIVMIKKPNGKYRFCLDFRKVNDVSKKDAYPLPNMNGILDKLRSARYISTIDLSQAYFQVPLANESREITAFSVPGKGLYQFTRMPYGLTGAPATFQRLLDRLIGPEMEPHAFAYLDDIVIVTPTFKEHLEWLDRVLQKILAAGLTINPEKCEFCRAQVKYLGFIVSKEGLSVDPEKAQPILEYPAPTNLKQLRRFLGMSSWYRRFIPQFATRSEPLTRLLKKDQPWKWTNEQVHAFEEIRSYLVAAPTLSRPDFSIPFVLQTDASSVGIGAVLTQTINEEEHVIAFASRALADPEKRYTVTEQECLAVIWAIKKFRPYLEGYKFTVITDHSSLRWLHNLKNPTGRLARWALELLEYDYEIIHRKGALHHVPDALSRMFEGDTEIPIVAAVDVEENANTNDAWYKKRLTEVATKARPFTDWRIVDGQLYFCRPKPVVSEIVEDLDRWKLVLPRELRRDALREAHDEPRSGHLGVEKTYHRLAVRYYWPNMFRDITDYVKRCEVCQRTKVEQASPKGLMGQALSRLPGP
ncbi:uncharacterized protein LOC114934886 [Nylanderia fulva]|uniref:uncharacterized protein LOC114934886 n=1 Tax=Nylanderia fulva TaxID=613905 RepID=UPI0010FBBD47|nr:uncharacterized protein LOC114934886 [Nylanderia fulva]